LLKIKQGFLLNFIFTASIVSLPMGLITEENKMQLLFLIHPSAHAPIIHSSRRKL
jgi:biotin transporter BioY